MDGVTRRKAIRLTGVAGLAAVLSTQGSQQVSAEPPAPASPTIRYAAVTQQGMLKKDSSRGVKGVQKSAANVYTVRFDGDVRNLQARPRIPLAYRGDR